MRRREESEVGFYRRGRGTALFGMTKRDQQRFYQIHRLRGAKYRAAVIEALGLEPEDPKEGPGGRYPASNGEFANMLREKLKKGRGR